LSISADDQKTFAQFEEKFKNCFYSKRDTNQDMMGLPRDAFIVDGRFRKGYRQRAKTALKNPFDRSFYF